MSRKNFHNALNQLDLHKKTKEPEIPGILGFTVNTAQVVEVPYRPGYVYVRLRNNTSEVIQAYNSDVPTTYGLPVVITRDEVDRSRYKVKGRDLGIYQNWGTANAYVPDHTHSFFNGFLALDDAVFIATGVSIDFKEDIYATAAGTAITVGVPTGTFSRPTHTHPNTNTDTVIIYEDSVFKVTGTAINFTDNINVVISGSVAHVSSIDTVGGGGGGADLLIYDNATFKVTGTALNFGDNLDVVVTGTTAYITAVGVTGSVGPIGPQGPEGATGSVGPQGIQGIQGIQGPQGDNTLLLYDDNTFKITGTAVHFNNNLSVVTSGSHAWVDGQAGSVGGGGSDILIYDDSTFVATGTSISFNGNLNVVVTGTAVYVSSPITTYQRVAQPIPLSSVTGTNWIVPDRVYASGSLAVFQSGLILAPVLDFQEAIWVSGTYFLTNVYPTGTVFVTMYGVPCVPQAYTAIAPTPANALLDSNSILLLDSNGTQILDSNG